MFENRNYIIISYQDLYLIDFEKASDTSLETVRKNVSGDKAVIEWEPESSPDFLEALVTYDGPYNHSEILVLLSEESWKIKEVPK
jgi:hypothetical protein